MGPSDHGPTRPWAYQAMGPSDHGPTRPWAYQAMGPSDHGPTRPWAHQTMAYSPWSEAVTVGGCWCPSAAHSLYSARFTSCLRAECCTPSSIVFRNSASEMPDRNSCSCRGTQTTMSEKQEGHVFAER